MPRRQERWRGFTRSLAGLATLAPGRAWACPACYGGDEGPLLTYFLTGVLMSVLPLALIAFTGIWFYRRTRVSSAGPAAAEASSPRPRAPETLTPVPSPPPNGAARPSL